MIKASQLLAVILVAIVITTAAGGLSTSLSPVLNNSGRSLSGLSLSIRKPLRICVISGDFYGRKGAGGTATAFHNVADALIKSPLLRITFLAGTDDLEICNAAAEKHGHEKMAFRCLEPQHLRPNIVRSYPLEQIAHGILAWVQDNMDQFDVILSHEWGGLILPLASAMAHRQLRPGMRLMVQPRGGHVWSRSWKPQQWMGLLDLRADEQERLDLQLADTVISPTEHMVAYLVERGWLLPASTIILPNVMPDIVGPARTGDSVAVWRLAFFSRLETRKGIKLFVDALSLLDRSKLDPRFEVVFVGAHSRIDGQESELWLRSRTDKWPWPTRIYVDLPRNEALQIIQEEGMLVILASLIEATNNVVAEAATLGIPFLTFAPGGTLELFDLDVAMDFLVKEPTAESLAERIQDVLHGGQIRTIEVSQRVKDAALEWRAWGKQMANNLPAFVREDRRLLKGLTKLKRTSAGKVDVIHVGKKVRAPELWRQVCRPSASSKPDYLDRPLLIIPEGYELLPGLTKMMSGLLYITAVRNRGIGAFAFGVEMANEKVSFPSAPTWSVYSGREDNSYCFEEVPLLLRTRVFCNVFPAHDDIFRHYRSWMMVRWLNQAGLLTLTYPVVAFRACDFNESLGYMPCSPFRLHEERANEYIVLAGKTFTDAGAFLHMHEYFRLGKPVASLKTDFPLTQGHMGWSFGYLPYPFLGKNESTAPKLNLLTWVPDRARWGCESKKNAFPYVSSGQFHPCASGKPICCGNKHAAVVVRFTSYFTLERARIVFTWESKPKCGDGMVLSITLYRANNQPSEALAVISIDQNPTGALVANPVTNFQLALNAGDIFDVVVEPRKTMACDGFAWRMLEIWKE